MRREIGEELRVLLGDPLLRSMTVSSALGSLALGIQGAVLVLYATQDLGVTPTLLGVVFASRGAASLLGAALSGPAGRRLGSGRAVILGTLVGAVGSLALPLAGGPPAVAVSVLVGAQVLMGAGAPIYSVSQLSLRQEITPDRLLGRVNAGRRFVVFGAGPVGALLGGYLGGQVGLRPTLLVGGLGFALAFLASLLSPLRARRDRHPLAPDSTAHG